MRWALVIVAACGSRADPSPHVSPSPPPVKLVPIDAGGCPPLSITLDGKPLTPSAIARGTGAAYEIDVDRAGSLACEQRKPAALFVVGALRAPSNTMVGIDFGSHSERATTRIVGASPTKPGDPLDVCVDPPVTVNGDGHMWLTVAGLIHATYCGESP